MHKGLALYQLGISQIDNGNFDEGIPNILEAYDEDIRNRPVWATFLPASQTAQRILDYAGNLIDTDFLSKLTVDLPTHFLLPSMTTLLSKLPVDEHLFLSRLIISNKILIHRNDTFTRIIMFNNLLNIYLLIETFLRTKKSIVGTLGNLIQINFCNKSWYPTYKNFIGTKKKNPNSLTCYDDYSANPQYPYYNQLSLIRAKSFSTNNEENFIIRMFLSSLLTRNYLAHGYDSTSQILNSILEYSRLFELAIGLFLYCLI